MVQQKKRLFVFCDGTWQDGVNNNEPLTNVATLARCLNPYDENGLQQLAYYDSGVGNVTSLPAQLIDAATGRGISAKIRNAYSFLSHNYNFDALDEIVLVGFSRGAFAVQCLASFISQTGLLQKQHLYYLRGLFTIWANQKVKGGVDELNKAKMDREGELKKVRITACAVYDTVSALGIFLQPRPRPLAFVGHEIPVRVQHAFQALALDETRRKFKPTVWTNKESDMESNDYADQGGRKISQCWFLGSHGDVGGNGDAALGALSLLWMVGKLDRIGVSFSQYEIEKHLKHRFLDWTMSVNRILRSFRDTRTLSTLEHSGHASKQAWYWLFLGWKSRSSYIGMSTDEVPMEIHFSVRLGMKKNNNKCDPLKHWKTSWLDGVVRWKPKNSSKDLKEHRLDSQRKEYKFLRKWIFPEGNLITERGDFAKVKVANSEEGLMSYAGFLQGVLQFEQEGGRGRLAPTILYG